MTFFQLFLWFWRIKRTMPEVVRLAQQHPDDLAYSIPDARNAFAVFIEFSSQVPHIERTTAEEGEIIEMLFLALWQAHHVQQNKQTKNPVNRWSRHMGLKRWIRAHKRKPIALCPFCALFGEEPEPLDTDFFGSPRYIGLQRACYPCSVVAEGQEEELLQRLKEGRGYLTFPQAIPTPVNLQWEPLSKPEEGNGR